MALPVYDNANGTTASTPSSITFAYTCSAGSNRGLVVHIVFYDSSGKTLNTVTYNGVAMTSILSTTNGNYKDSVWFLANPASGANNIVATWSGAINDNASLTAISFTGVKQTGQPDASNSAVGSANPPVDTGRSITSVLNDCMLVDFFKSGNADGTSHLTPSGGQTERYENAAATSFFSVAVSEKAAPTAGANTMGYTDTIASSATWEHLLISLAPVGATTYTQGLPVTALAVISLAKLLTVVKGLSATASAVLALSKVRTVVKSLTQTATAIVTLSKIKTAVRTMTVTGTSVPAVSRIFTALRSLTQTATGVISLTRVATHLRSLPATSAAIVALTKARLVVLSLLASASAVPSLATIRTALRTFAVAPLAILSFRRQVSKTLSVTPSVSVALSRLALFARSLSVNASATTTLTKGLLRFVILTVSAVARLKIYVNGLASRYAQKYPAQGTAYASKYPAQGTSYEQKYLN